MYRDRCFTWNMDAPDGAGTGGGPVDSQPDPVQSGEPSTVTDDLPGGLDGVDMDAVSKGAAKLMESLHPKDESPSESESDGESGRPRDEKGRFTVANQPPVESSEPEYPEGVGKEWVELAREEGIRDELIRSARSDDDIRGFIATERYNRLTRLGIEPNEFAAFRAWRQNGQSQPQQTPSAPSTKPETSVKSEAAQALEDLAIKDLNDEELDPSLSGTIKTMAEYVNRLKADYAARYEKLERELGELKSAEEQRANQAVNAEREARLLNQFDSAASKIEGFKEFFGPAAELNRLAKEQPNHEKVLLLRAWDAYFAPAYQKYASIMGQTDRALELALRDAWNESDAWRQAISLKNGKPQRSPVNHHKANGVVSHAHGARAPAMAGPDAGTLDEHIQNARKAMKDAWGVAGGNPFNRDDLLAR